MFHEQVQTWNEIWEKIKNSMIIGPGIIQNIVTISQVALVDSTKSHQDKLREIPTPLRTPFFL